MDARITAVNHDFACRHCGNNGFATVVGYEGLDADLPCPECGAEAVDKGVMRTLLTGEEGDRKPYTCPTCKPAEQSFGCIVFFPTIEPDIFSCKICRAHKVV